MLFTSFSGSLVSRIPGAVQWADRDGLCLFAKRLAGDPGRESTPDASSVIHATGGDRVATSQTDRTAWHPDITRDKTRE
ncbi:isocitrate lyase [Shigella sp. FC1180]|nr:isocitrate lyase [Shigella flexneri 1a]AMN60811.1 isocitrate lyase [Shigella flexneri 2a]AMN65564.1 isocitrate lyase [Shigella flexneri 4c]ODJ22621.1 isocitrate lyase [Shigella sp. FC1180]ODQ18840.1 isocitrate lyase [Shigella sp. FC1139]